MMSPQRSSFGHWGHFRIFIASRNCADGLVSRELKYLISYAKMTSGPVA